MTCRAPRQQGTWFVTVAAAATAAMATLAGGCRAMDGDAPPLPPADSMEMGEFVKGGGTTAQSTAALAGAGGAGGVPAPTAGSTANVDLAALSVGLVTAAVNTALASPRLLFAGMLTARPTLVDDAWVWEKDFPLAGWHGKLTGSYDGALDLEMRVTGLRGDMAAVQNFIWYTGHHQATSGVWHIFSPDVTGPVVDIDWARASATDKDLTFTNVTTGMDGSGDVIAYALKGRVASMTVHDAQGAQGAPADFSVTWNVVTGEGKMVRPAGPACWNTLASGQVDIPCPTGAWPMP